MCHILKWLTVMQNLMTLSAVQQMLRQFFITKTFQVVPVFLNKCPFFLSRILQYKLTKNVQRLLSNMLEYLKLWILSFKLTVCQ